MNIKQTIIITSAFAIMLSLAISIPVLAEENDRGPGSGPMMSGWQKPNDDRDSLMNRFWSRFGLERKNASTTKEKDGKVTRAIRPDVVGKVSSINGNTITVDTRQGFGTSTNSITYTVDAGNATIFRINATSSVSEILVGDNILIQGTISGTNVSAKLIRVNAPQIRQEKPKTGTSTEIKEDKNKPKPQGFVTGMGQFFKRLFRF